MIDFDKHITNQEMEEWVNEWKAKINTIENPMIIPPPFYEWLEKKGLLLLTKEQKIDYITNQAVTLRQYLLMVLVKSEGKHGQSLKELNEFNRMRNQGYFTGIEVERLKGLAKKIAVFDYLKAVAQEEKNKS